MSAGLLMEDYYFSRAHIVIALTMQYIIHMSTGWPHPKYKAKWSTNDDSGSKCDWEHNIYSCGTGTRFQSCIGLGPRPIYYIKGGLGTSHTIV